MFCKQARKGYLGILYDSLLFCRSWTVPWEPAPPAKKACSQKLPSPVGEASGVCGPGRPPSLTDTSLCIQSALSSPKLISCHCWGEWRNSPLFKQLLVEKSQASPASQNDCSSAGNNHAGSPLPEDLIILRMVHLVFGRSWVFSQLWRAFVACISGIGLCPLQLTMKQRSRR